MTSWPIFHVSLTSDFGQIIKVKIFVQGRILSSSNDSKLIFHMIFHGLLMSDFGQFSMVKIFIIGSFLSSVDGSKLIFY